MASLVPRTGAQYARDNVYASPVGPAAAFNSATPADSYAGRQNSYIAQGYIPTTTNGSENRDTAIEQDAINAHKSPSYYALSAIPGYSNYAAVKSYLGWKKNKRAYNEAKDQKSMAQQAGIAGEDALAYGFTPTSGAKHNRQTWQDAENAAVNAKNSAAVNESYGYLPTMASARNTNPYNKALAANSLISGSIERSVGTVRDSEQHANLAGAEGAARQASFSAANSGMTGSSTDLDTKQGVLGGYLSGRQDTALAANETRSTARSGMEQERLDTLAQVKGLGPGANFQRQIADMSMINALGQAKRNVLPNALGGAIGNVGELYANSLLYGAANNGGGAGGASLPSLSGGSSRPTGGLSTTPRTRQMV